MNRPTVFLCGTSMVLQVPCAKSTVLLRLSRCSDPSLDHQFDWVHDEVDKAFDRYWSAGFRGPELAMLVGRDAERPVAGAEVKYSNDWAYLRSQVEW